MSTRTNALADRLEHGARELAAFARGLTPAEWQVRVPGDGRKVGVVVHHVATMYPLEIQLAQRLAEGEPVSGVTWSAVHELTRRTRRSTTVSPRRPRWSCSSATARRRPRPSAV